MKRSLSKRFILYILVGLCVAAFQFLSFAFFFQLLGWSYLVSTTLSFILTALVSYTSQRTITFAKDEERSLKLHHSLLLFVANSGAGLLINDAIMYLGVDILAQNAYFVQLGSIIFLAGYNFFVYHLIFK